MKLIELNEEIKTIANGNTQVMYANTKKTKEAFSKGCTTGGKFNNCEPHKDTIDDGYKEVTVFIIQNGKKMKDLKFSDVGVSITKGSIRTPKEIFIDDDILVPMFDEIGDYYELVDYTIKGNWGQKGSLWLHVKEDILDTDKGNRINMWSKIS